MPALREDGGGAMTNAQMLIDGMQSLTIIVLAIIQLRAGGRR